MRWALILFVPPSAVRIIEPSHHRQKLDFAVIKCVGYDANVAGKLQGQMAQN